MNATQDYLDEVEWRLDELANIVGVTARGDYSKKIRRISTLQDATQDSITYFSDERFRKYLDVTKAGVVILNESDADGFVGNCLIAPNPRAVFAKVALQLNPDKKDTAGIHSSAIVSKDAKIATSATILQGAIVESGASIGEDCIIGPGSVIGERVSIADHTRIDSNVTIYKDCIIGRNCVINANSVIGAPGFSFTLEEGRWVQIPNYGAVSIGDDVSIGASTTIDRGTINNTVIGNGVKIDNNVQIAHNVEIGEHTIIAGNVGVAGSAKIGNQCMFGGQAGVLDHVEICDHVVVNAGSLVTKSITTPGEYSATIPAQPVSQWRRTFASLRRLGKNNSTNTE